MTQDVLDAVDFESYKNQKMTSNARISLSEDEELQPIPTTLKGTSEPEKDLLEHIVSDFNTRFGTNFSSEDSVKKMLSDISDEIVADKRMMASLQTTDKSNRKLEFKKLLDEKLTTNVDDHLELYNNYFDSSDFQDHLVRYLDKVVSEKLK